MSDYGQHKMHSLLQIGGFQFICLSPDTTCDRTSTIYSPHLILQKIKKPGTKMCI